MVNSRGRGATVVPSTTSITMLSLAAASVGLKEVNASSQEGQVLYQASLTNTTNNTVDLVGIRRDFVRVDFMFQGTFFVSSITDGDVVVVDPSGKLFNNLIIIIHFNRLYSSGQKFGKIFIRQCFNQFPIC